MLQTIKNDPVNGHAVLNGHAAPALAHANGVAEKDTPAIRSAQAETPEEQAFDLNPAGLMQAFRRRWYLILPVAIMGAAAATWFASQYLATPSYTARTFLRVADQPGILANGASRGDLAGFQKSQTAMVKSRYVLRLAYEQLKSRNLDMLQGADPVPGLEANMKADFSVAPDILQITLKGESPEETTVVLDAIREAYLAEVINKDRTTRKTQLDQVNALIARQGDEVEKQQRLLNDKLSTLRVRDVAAQKQRLQQTQTELASLQVELRLVQSALARLEMEAKAIAKERDLPRSVIDAAVEEALKKDSVTLDWEAQAAKLEKYISDHKGASDKVTAALKEAMAKLDAVRKQQAERRATIVKETIEKLKEQQRRELPRLHGQIDIKKQEERHLTEQV